MKRVKQMMVRSISLLIVTVIVFGLTGCKPGTKGKTSAEDSKQSVTGTDIGYPIVKEPLTLQYWSPFNASAAKYIASYAENEAYMEAEKRTGIHIEFIHPAINQENEQFNLMIASMNLPDMINGSGRYKGGVPKGIEDGVFKDISASMQKYAPDYYKLVRSDIDIFRQAAMDDGRISAFYQIKPKEQEDPPYHGAVIRQDWLDELGLQMPKTIDDWYITLKAFKEKKKAEAPLLLGAGGFDAVAGSFLTAYDVAPGDFYLKDGKVVDSPKIQPKFKEYLALMNKWYSEGLIAKDFPTLKAAQQQTLFSSGRVGAANVFAVGVAVSLGEAANINVTIAPMPRLKAGDVIHFRYPAWPVTGEETVVTASSKHPIEAVRWLNYPYTQEGALLFNFGIEGKSWVKGPDGKPQFTDYMLKNPKIDVASVGNIFRVHFMPKFTYSDMVANPGIIGTKSVDLRKEWGKEKNRDEAFAIPPIRLSVEDSARRAQILSEVNPYINEMILKFITGQEPLSKYDDYVKQVKALNIEEAVKITQKGYDDYMKINMK